MKKLTVLLVLATLLVSVFSFGANAASAAFTTAEEAAGGKTLLGDKVDQASIAQVLGNFGTEAGVNMFDGDTATKYCTNEFPATVTWKMDQAYIVDRIVIATANDNASYNGRSPLTWTISGSTDGTNYTVIYSGTDTDFEETDLTYYYVDVAGAAAYQYYKFDCPETISGTFQVSELVLCGAPAAAPAAETTAAPETAAPETAAPETAAPEAAAQTADVFGVVALAAVLAIGAAVVISKRK